MNQKQKTERQWEKPTLIVLVRGQPEEAVLVVCKTAAKGTGPDVTANYCGNVIQTNCGACHSRGGGVS